MSVWTMLSLPGVVVALFEWGVVAVIGSAVAVAVPLALSTALVRHDRALSTDENAPEMSRRWIGQIALCAVCLVISLAVYMTIPGLTAFMALLAGVTTPPARDIGRQVLRQLTPATPAPTTPPTHGASTSSPVSPPPATGLRNVTQVVHLMTDQELCRAWRRSYWTMHEAHSPVEKLRLVQQRQNFLDELATRDALALKAWLASGARACGGPDKFFNDKLSSDDAGDRPTAA